MSGPVKLTEVEGVGLTEVENVYNLTESGARGATGPAGTIGTLDTLTSKPVVVAADLALVGDSADSFANKKATWLQVINSVIRTALDLIYQPVSTALSKITEAGGLPLWDGGAWPGGGGGGGIYEVVESRTLIGNVDEIFNVNGEDDIMFIYENLISSLATSLLLYMSSDNGVSYPGTHQSFLQRLDQTNGELLSSNLNFAFVYLTRSNSIWFNGWTKLHSLQSAGGNRPNFESKVNHNGSSSSGYRTNVEGWNNTVGPVTDIKFTGLNTFTGKIHILKRTI